MTPQEGVDSIEEAAALAVSLLLQHGLLFGLIY